MRDLANRLEATVALFVEEGDHTVSVSMIEPTTSSQHIAFRLGMRTPIDRGAAGFALLSLREPSPDDVPRIVQARKDGFVQSFAEIEEGTYAVAAPIRLSGANQAACINVMTFRGATAQAAGPDVKAAAESVARLLS
jgi:DNA-binding IclR family transcriptional regulator